MGRLRKDWINKLGNKSWADRMDYLHEHCPGMGLEDIRSFCAAMYDLALMEASGKKITKQPQKKDYKKGKESVPFPSNGKLPAETE